VKIIPNGSVRYEYASSDFDDPATGRETFTDNLGVADLGLVISIGFAIRR